MKNNTNTTTTDTTTLSKDVLYQDFKTAAILVSLLTNLTVLVAWSVYQLA